MKDTHQKLKEFLVAKRRKYYKSLQARMPCWQSKWVTALLLRKEKL
jgi:hypothetical protein